MNNLPRFLKVISLGALFLLGIHFLWLRIHAPGWPAGDEGSWMSVAAEFARGRGFTTRWLEFHWLQPYTLPRPDDFRYPFLTLILASSFRLFGFTYSVGLITVATLFLGFAAAFFFAMRRYWGSTAAVLGVALLICSPLQLEWNSQIYTEGLFGLMLSGLAYYSFKERIRSYPYWIGLGIGIGLLCLVRPNGILFAPGLIALWWFRRREGATWMHLTSSLISLGIMVSPWLIRNRIFFGNPFHVAGSAGLLRAEHAEAATATLTEYLSKNGIGFPLYRLILGIPRFMRDLHFFEHGLEIIPLLLFLWSLRRGRFYNPFLTTGFALSFLACGYSAYNSWAGVRYFTAFLPFLYVAGVAEAMAGISWAWMRMEHRAFAVLALTGILLLPVLNPHRFYERHYGTLIGAELAIQKHSLALGRILPQGGNYYAQSLCQVNFQNAHLNCVGLQELNDPSWYAKSETTFKPRILALRPGEERSVDMLKAGERFKMEGFSVDTLEVLDSTYYLRLNPSKR